MQYYIAWRGWRAFFYNSVLCLKRIYFSEVCEIPIFTNGYIIPHSRGVYKANETAHIMCNSGFVTHIPLTRCTSSRIWDPEPLCCNMTCVVPSIWYGLYRHNDATAFLIELRCGATITPFCTISSFTIMPSTPRTCQLDGTWSGAEPVCIPIICNSLPPDIQHGRYGSEGSASSFSYNHHISPVCDEGYYLQTHMVRTCIFTDTWSGNEPTCLRITCTHPDEFNNGHYNRSLDTYDYGSVLIPTCDYGYFISNNVSERVCETSNFWSGNDPVCEIIKCFRPTVQNGLFTPTRNFYDYKSQIKIQCNMNFEIKDGPDTRTCQEDGTWGLNTLQCVKIMCNDTLDVSHKSINTYPELAFGEIGSVLYNSTVFYLRSGSVEVICSVERKLSWISTPEFGRFLNVFMDVLTSVTYNLYETDERERHKKYLIINLIRCTHSFTEPLN